MWKAVTAVLGGQPLPDAVVQGTTLKITGGTYTVTIQGTPQPDKGTCLVDMKASPKRITIKSNEGPNRGKTFLAIYEFGDNDSMQVCYDLTGQAFPKKFKSEKGTQLYLVNYRRQK